MNDNAKSNMHDLVTEHLGINGSVHGGGRVTVNIENLIVVTDDEELQEVLNDEH